MDKKGLLRKKFFKKRKIKYFKIDQNFFSPLKKLIDKKFKKKKLNFSLYFPSSYEVDILKILDDDYFRKSNFLLPIIEKGNVMNFYRWKKMDILYVNKYGLLEPIKSKRIIPDVVMVPLLAFDKYKNRLGYGKGFYDKFLNRYLSINKKIITVGVAFSFQRYHKLPNTSRDYKLNYIITEKGII